MKFSFSIFLLIALLLLCVNTESSQNPNQQQDDNFNYLYDKVKEYILKTGIKVIANPKLFKSSLKIIVEKVFKTSLTRSTLKKIPIAGVLSGFGFGAWRALNGQYKTAGAEIASGFAGATGLGIGPSLAIDVGILISDVVQQLQKKGMIQTSDKQL